MKLLSLLFLGFLTLNPIKANCQKYPEISEYSVMDIVSMAGVPEMSATDYTVSISLDTGTETHEIYKGVANKIQTDTLQLFLKNGKNYYILDRSSIRNRIYDCSYNNNQLISDLNSYQNSPYYKSLRNKLKKEKGIDLFIVFESPGEKIIKQIRVNII